MYQALYRKYRPQTFDEVVGQSAVTQTLKAQLRSGKLSHAYLFTGSRGTGKTSCAKILAKAVNCENPQDGNPCNICPACRSIDSGACTDVLEIDAASNNGVDHVRALRDEAVYTPAEVRRRVYIIDEVHMLSISAFNALLKIIEEPPEHLLFILATTELHKVPATILSRCQRFSFRRLLPDDIAGRLQYAAQQEGIAIEPEAITKLSLLADGALRDGMSLLDQCASATDGTVTREAVDQVLGLAGSRATVSLLSCVAEHDTRGALSLFSELYAAGRDVAAMLDELCTIARDLLILKTVPKDGENLLSGVYTADELEPLCGRFSAGELLYLTTLLQQTAAGFSRSADHRLDAELCLMQLCQPMLRDEPQALSARLSRVEEQLARGVVPAAPAVRVQEQDVPPWDNEDAPPWDDADAPPAEEEEPVTPAPAAAVEEPLGFWPDFLTRVRPQLPIKARGFFAASGPVSGSVQGDALVLTAQSSFVKDIISDQQVLALLRDAATALLGRQMTVRVQLPGAKTDEAPNENFADLMRFGAQHSDVIKIK